MLFFARGAAGHLFHRKSAWEKYNGILQEQVRGMCPYWVPNSSDGPGTILEIVGGAEQLFLSSQKAFPDIEADTSVIPAVFASKISDIKFKIGANADDKQVLPPGVEAVANIAYKNATTMSLEISNPRLVRIENALLTAALKEFNLDDPLQDEILKKLMEPNTRLISGAIFVDGFEFKFNKVDSLTTALEARLTKGTTLAQLGFQKINNNTFLIKANTPMFLAYYAYTLKQDEIGRLYANLQQQRQLKNEIDSIVLGDFRVSSVPHAATAKGREWDSSESVGEPLKALRPDTLIHTKVYLSRHNAKLDTLKLKSVIEELKNMNYDLFGDQMLQPTYLLRKKMNDTTDGR
jgi:hypothetical protein